jgi:hypothetical protein
MIGQYRIGTFPIMKVIVLARAHSVRYE